MAKTNSNDKWIELYGEPLGFDAGVNFLVHETAKRYGVSPSQLVIAVITDFVETIDPMETDLYQALRSTRVERLNPNSDNNAVRNNPDA